jgi:DNA-binding IclR family transcriptional regulator
MLALKAVAEHPGASNRVLAEVAEIGDQGQVSKLLARLQRVGLIENTGLGAAARGEPNAWRLTARGRSVHEMIANL